MTQILVNIGTLALVLLSLFLVLIILTQRSKGSALGSSLGGGAAESTFGADAGNVLSRVTIISASIFFLLAFVLYLANTAEREPVNPLPASLQQGSEASAPKDSKLDEKPLIEEETPEKENPEK